MKTPIAISARLPRTSRATPALLASMALLLGGCAAIEGIFKAGLWVGIVAVVALVAVVGGVAALMRR